jgi:SWI/SNF-related matrix-associated actin-dependent regulator of chromatin subfamily A member 5
VHNNLHELWSLLYWLYPSIFTPASERQFRDAFDLSRGAYSLPFLTAAQNLLRTIMLRRTKATVTLDVPPREEMTVWVPLSEAQRFWTYRLLTRMDSTDLEDIFEEGIGGGDGGALEEGRKAVREHIRTSVAQSQTGQQSRAYISFVHFRKEYG